MRSQNKMPSAKPVVMCLSVLVACVQPALLAANEACRAPGGGFSRNTQLQRTELNATSLSSDAAAAAEVVTAASAALTCFDGTRPAYFYRPCCDGEVSAVTPWHSQSSRLHLLTALVRAQ
jgi:hypothetical protein